MKPCECGGKLGCYESRVFKGNQRRKYKCNHCSAKSVTIEIEKPDDIAEAALAIFKDLNKTDLNAAVKIITGLSFAQTDAIMGVIEEFKRCK